MVEANIVLTLLQTLSIMVGIGYYILNIQNNQKNQQIALRNQELTLESQNQALETRQAQLFMNIYNQFVRKEFTEDWIMVIWHREWESIEDYQEKYGSLKNPKESARQISVFAFFEGIGVLLKRNLINISMVDDLMSSYVILLWSKYGPMY